MLSFACPGCGGKFQVGDELAGKRLKSPHCGGAVRVLEPQPLRGAAGSAVTMATLADRAGGDVHNAADGLPQPEARTVLSPSSLAKDQGRRSLMSVQLLVVAGPDKGKVIEVAAGDSVFVGRSKAAAARLSDPSVSRIHFQVEFDGKQARLTDFESTGGTFVNGQRVTSQALRPGDVIQAGDTSLRLVGGAAEEGATLVAAARPTAPAAPPPPAPPPPREKAASAKAPARQPGLAELVGKELSRYRIESVVARGRSGMVFRAVNTKSDEVVALKVLRPEFARNEEAKRRFVRAMKTVLPLRHPNLVAVLAAGKEGGWCWVAMEFVEGENLQQALHRRGVAGRLDWRNAFRLALYLAQGLEYAHGQQIIHRNITPTNVLIREKDKLAKLGDLMLAKALEGTLAEQITGQEEVLGDVAYLSPEQTRGSAEADARSDLYGLGATLYTALTGRPPFEAGSLTAMIEKVRNEPPRPLTEAQLSIPGPMEGLIQRMLDKRPENRFQTATELLAELDRIARVLRV